MNSQILALQGLEKFGFGHYFRYFLENNSGLHNPYHNLNHTLRIMSFISDACLSNDFDEEGLLLAGLYHDFNHSGGKLSDAENVRIAVKGFNDADSWVGEKFGDSLRVPTSLKDRVISYIKATQYPYVIPDKDLDIHQSLIRDSDVLCYFADDWFTHVLSGLAKEMGFVDYAVALDRMEEFLTQCSQSARTDYAKMIFEGKFPEWKREKDESVKLLDYSSCKSNQFAS